MAQAFLDAGLVINLARAEPAHDLFLFVCRQAAVQQAAAGLCVRPEDPEALRGAILALYRPGPMSWAGWHMPSTG